MKVTEQHLPRSPIDGIREALRPSPVTGAQPAEAGSRKEREQRSCATAIDIRRLMLQSQEFRNSTSSANANPAAIRNGKDFEKMTIDTVIACLAICANEERREISFGSREGASAMRRSMHAIKAKFGIA